MTSMFPNIMNIAPDAFYLRFLLGMTNKHVLQVFQLVIHTVPPLLQHAPHRSKTAQEQHQISDRAEGDLGRERDHSESLAATRPRPCTITAAMAAYCGGIVGMSVLSTTIAIAASPAAVV